MKPLADQVSPDAAAQRDHRNLMTHLDGTPMIVVAATRFVTTAVRHDDERLRPCGSRSVDGLGMGGARRGTASPREPPSSTA